MQQIMQGEASAAQIGGFLIGLHMKGETVTEIATAAQVMRELALAVEVADHRHLMDTCGTGGDGQSLFNVSTAVAFIVAAAGGKVAKHGNRSVSSRCGSADVLEAAGVRLELAPAQVARCIDELGVGFLFAPAHHQATRHVAQIRRELGVRTVFNLLGPLTNPARVPCQLVGVYAAHWVRPLAEVLQALGSRHVLVVHAEDGLDEISIAAPTQVAELRDGLIHEYRLDPVEFGLAHATLDTLRVTDAQASLRLLRQVFAGETGPARDIVLINAAAALYAADLAEDLPAGLVLARQMLDTGTAAERLVQLIHFSHRPA
jgi:anthranilate phosphoribosyltransferase